MKLGKGKSEGGDTWDLGRYLMQGSQAASWLSEVGNACWSEPGRWHYLKELVKKLIQKSQPIIFFNSLASSEEGEISPVCESVQGFCSVTWNFLQAQLKEKLGSSPVAGLITFILVCETWQEIKCGIYACWRDCLNSLLICCRKGLYFLFPLYASLLVAAYWVLTQGSVI